MELQKQSFPHLSGTRAWTCKSYVDLILRHNGAKTNPVQIPDERAARAISMVAPQKYAESLDILRLLFGKEHEHYTTVDDKADALERELARILGSDWRSAS